MLKSVMAAAIAAAFVLAVPLAASQAQTAAPAEKSDAKPAKKKAAKPAGEKKKLTAQQQKMKDCAGKWGEEKKNKNVKGRAAYRKFMSGCLKG